MESSMKDDLEVTLKFFFQIFQHVLPCVLLKLYVIDCFDSVNKNALFVNMFVATLKMNKLHLHSITSNKQFFQRDNGKRFLFDFCFGFNCEQKGTADP